MCGQLQDAVVNVEKLMMSQIENVVKLTTSDTTHPSSKIDTRLDTKKK